MRLKAISFEGLFVAGREALERVIAASRDATMVGMAERQVAWQECDAAMAAFGEIATRLP